MRYFIGLLFFLSTMVAQVTDKNFKDKISDGFSVIVFTSEWQERELDAKILDGVKGYENAKIINQWTSKNKLQNVTIITSYYHMPRSMMLIKSLTPSTNFYAYPVEKKVSNKISFREFKLKKDNDEETLGKLFSYFILETILIGKLTNINPFNQPAVEQVKVVTKNHLLK